MTGGYGPAWEYVHGIYAMHESWFAPSEGEGSRALLLIGEFGERLGLERLKKDCSEFTPGEGHWGIPIDEGKLLLPLFSA
jgi:hypothetical protein